MECSAALEEGNFIQHAHILDTILCISRGRRCCLDIEIVSNNDERRILEYERYANYKVLQRHN